MKRQPDLATYIVIICVGFICFGRMNSSYARASNKDTNSHHSETQQSLPEDLELAPGVLHQRIGNEDFIYESGAHELVYRRYQNAKELKLTFRLEPSTERFKLEEINVSASRRLFNGGSDSGDAFAELDTSSSETPPIPLPTMPGKQCSDASSGLMTVVIGNRAAEGDRFQNCSPAQQQVIAGAIELLLAKARVQTPSPFSCDKVPGLQLTTANARQKMIGTSSSKFVCDKSTKSNYVAETDKISLGQEMFRGTIDDGARVLYHELVHAGLEKSEFLTQEIVKCCLDSDGNSASACEAVPRFQELKTVLQNELESGFANSDSSTSEKLKLLLDINNATSTEQFCEGPSGEAGGAQKILDLMNARIRKKSAQDPKLKAAILAAYSVTCPRKGNTGRRQTVNTVLNGGSAASSESTTATSGQPAPAPQNLIVTANATRVSDSPEIARTRRTFSTLRTGASDVGRRFAAAAGLNNAVAALPTTNSNFQRNAEGSYSPKRVGTTSDGAPLFALNDQEAIGGTIASLREPFTGSESLSGVQIYNRATGKRTSGAGSPASLADVDSAAGATSPVTRRAANGKPAAREAGTSDSGSASLAPGSTDSSLSGGTGSSGSSASVAPSAPRAESSIPRSPASQIIDDARCAPNRENYLRQRAEKLRSEHVLVQSGGRWFPEGADVKSSLWAKKVNLDPLGRNGCAGSR